MTLTEIISFAATVFALLSACVGFLISLIKAIKSKNAEEVKNLLSEAAQNAVTFAESLTGAAGETKKAVALAQICRQFTERGIAYDETAASDAVESIITLSKEVNAREKDKPQVSYEPEPTDEQPQEGSPQSVHTAVTQTPAAVPKRELWA